jgi:hypothetical protein
MAISIRPCLHCWKDECKKKEDLLKSLNSIKDTLKENQVAITSIKLRCKESGSPFVSGNIVYDKIHKKYAIVLQVKFHKVHVKYEDFYTSPNGTKYTESWLNFDTIDIKKGIDLSKEYEPPRKKGMELPGYAGNNKLNKIIERLKGLYIIWCDRKESPTFDHENYMKKIDPSFDYQSYCKAKEGTSEEVEYA